ncbi:MAG: hypothetical protein ACP5L0_07770, partial [Caldisphaera sp.]
YAFFTPNDFYIYYDNSMTSLNNVSYTVWYADYNSNTEIDLLPDGSILYQSNIRTLYFPYNQLMQYYLVRTNNSWPILNTIHLYGNQGIIPPIFIFFILSLSLKPSMNIIGLSMILFKIFII